MKSENRTNEEVTSTERILNLLAAEKKALLEGDMILADLAKAERLKILGLNTEKL